MEIYSDYLKYLIEHTRDRLKDESGSDLWATHRDDAEIILTYPNLWDHEQRDFLREAAINADIIAEGRAIAHLHLVEEAEAAARYCISKFSPTFSTLMASGYLCYPIVSNTDY